MKRRRRIRMSKMEGDNDRGDEKEVKDGERRIRMRKWRGIMIGEMRKR